MYFQVRLTCGKDDADRWAFSVFKYIHNDYQCIYPTSPGAGYAFVYESAGHAFDAASDWCLHNIGKPTVK